MVFRCGFGSRCGKVFVHPAKIVEVKTDKETLETFVCPHCLSPIYEEVPQDPDLKSSIVSVKSVELDDVDLWLSMGYEVKELYAKTATLIKHGPPPQQESPHNPIANACHEGCTEKNLLETPSQDPHPYLNLTHPLIIKSAEAHP